MKDKKTDGIAIIGLGCKIPGADSPTEFWKMMLDGIDATSDLPDSRWNKRLFFSKDKAVPGKTYTIHGGFLDQIDQFDPEFFGISPREACYLDPQQKILLEVSWAAMEDAGITPASLKEKDVGVYIGAFTLDYKILQYRTENAELIDTHSATGLMMTMVSNRISYIYDFRGPSMTIDTACSSSLVALHLACKAMQNGECSLALVGGINIITSPEYTISESKGGFLAPDGRSKAFDSSANGYARGEGAGIVVLKPLAQAINDGDDIYAVIKGTGVNQDGHTNGITVPRGEAQENLMRDVYERAGIDPSRICYFEAHGTGTPVGDPIEANAIANVLKQGRKGDNKCVVGSVKTNIGHLEAAAGMAGLIKSCLIMKHRQIPPHLHFKNPNPKIAFDDLCIRVPTKIEALHPVGQTALIGVNSFGFGGTNAHTVLEEPPARVVSQTADSAERPEIILLSAHSEKALQAFAASLKALLNDNPEITLKDLAANLARHRTHHEQRLALPVRTKTELSEYLDAYINNEERKGMSQGKADPAKNNKLAFVFTGMGPIWWAMGRQLFATEPVFRNTLEKIDSYIKEFTDWSVITELHREEQDSKLDEPQFAQPANFALQAGLTDLWKAYGILPDAIVGHSVGEVTAAYASGILDLKTATKVSVERSRIQQKAIGLGTMLAVGLSEAEADALVKELNELISIAAINSDNAITLSGDANALQTVNARLQAKGIFSRLMKVNVAYHSCQMNSYKDELLEVLKQIRTNAPLIPVYSTVTGNLCGDEAFSGPYWWKNVREPVRFSKTIARMLDDGHRLFLEVGPHPVLASSIKECMKQKALEGSFLTSLVRNEDEQKTFYGTLGRLHVLGFPVDPEKISTATSYKIRFPVYPWQREKCWVESQESFERRTGSNLHPILGRKLKVPYPCWENDLSLDAYPFLEDHKIQGSTVFPGAGYIEIAHAFLKEYLPNEKCLLEKINFHKAIFLQNGKYPIIQFSYDQPTGAFKIYSRYAGGEEKQWALNASGTVSKNWEIRPEQKLDLQKLRSGDEILQLEKDECYAIFKGMGFDYGPNFRTIDTIYKSKDAVLCRIAITNTDFTHNTDYRLHDEV